MRLLVLLLLVAEAHAVVNCGIATDPFFATVSFNAREDIWRADVIVVVRDKDGSTIKSYTQHHWETRTISNKCVIHRVVYLMGYDFIYVYQQRILPALDGVYRIQEYIPEARHYRPVECVAERVDAHTINITSDWTDTRQITIVDPHQSYHEGVYTNTSDTLTIYTSESPHQQDFFVKKARVAFENGRLTETVSFPFPSFVFRPWGATAHSR